MADFLIAVSLLLTEEGGYKSRHLDHGAVNFGITEQFVIDVGIVGKDRAPEYILNLDKIEAIAIYQTFWWDEFHLGDLPQETATVMLQVIANMGPHHPVRLAQVALNKMGRAVDVDGVLGPKTRLQLIRVEERQFLRLWKSLLAERYRSIAAGNRKYVLTLRAWLARLDRMIPDQAQAAVGE